MAASEQMVVDHIPHALTMARRFSRESLLDSEGSKEVVACALFGLAQAAHRFKGGDNGALFWGFARRRVWGAMLDSVRFNRGRRVRIKTETMTERYDNSDEASIARSPCYNPWPAVEARMLIATLMPELTRKERHLIGCELRGEDPKMADVSRYQHRYNAIRRMREVLS